ncbi:hypothetical protein [Pseudidiomarina taiwanensis]|uniref:Uncharacterized protein n=1 Tax=Pseudidiomarina taiwanensis TaxID=337250 RepID=A0A432ZLJ3_9GAMM|nr:hypothetical protein [Pseudidiomarina taiwanensis]RUO78700.1 hypothetical protein CWI83_06685 [Pseudidiomarina taiwanensis]
MQTEAGQLNADHVNAVWYSDISGDTQWDFNESTFAKAKYQQGENMGFNGKRMLDLLPGGEGFDLTRASQAQKEAYAAFGPSQKGGLTALSMVISHELAHVTEVNSRALREGEVASELRSKLRAEQRASIVYFQLFGDSQ